MRSNTRRETRRPSRKNYSITWQDDRGVAQSSAARCVDMSNSGAGIRCRHEIPVGTAVYIQAEDSHPAGYAVVRHCTPAEGNFILGLEFNEETKKTVAVPPDYYEFLQISPNAESETIHRVYRFLAGRYHPDNPDTGDPESFLKLNDAFHVLSDPQRRKEYDEIRRGKPVGQLPEFESVDFMDGIEGETNRRLAVLAVLYRRCRTNVADPRVALPILEKLMGFPREYLDFTTWYLRTKRYINREDNSDFSLTVLGVDYVESNYSTLPVLRKLLDAGNSFASRTGPEENETEKTAARNPGAFILGGGRAKSGESD
jgi:curved DNA-binding protein